MCGIVGVIKRKANNVAKDLYFGLLAIQHRGQDASGMLVCTERKCYLKKGNGLVTSLFNEELMFQLPGYMGIGHVRYPTIGLGKEEEAQPFFIKEAGVGLAHNGNLLNYFQLREQLASKGVEFLSSSDGELLLQLFMVNYEGDPFEAAKKVMEVARGAFSIVMCIKDKGLMAIRDRFGFKPLVLGEKDGDYMMTSESVALDILQYRLVRDVKPGEAILITPEGEIIARQLYPAIPSYCIFEYVYFARPDSVINGIPVYKARYRLGLNLAKEVKKLGIKPDVVIPVPDTARTAAFAISEYLGVPYKEGLIKNRYIGRTFIMPRDEKRMERVKVKLNPVRYEIEGKRILLVDDSIVRGNTSRAIIQLVRQVNPTAVYFASTAPPLKHPCYYGIDMQTRREFIAKDKSVDEIRKVIGADVLVYQTLNGLVEGVDGDATFCTACFNGDYPIPPREEEIECIERQRLDIGK